MEMAKPVQVCRGAMGKPLVCHSFDFIRELFVYREKMTTLMFEDFNVPAMYVSIQVGTGLVVLFTAASTHFLCLPDP
jgi:actin-related protein